MSVGLGALFAKLGELGMSALGAADRIGDPTAKIAIIKLALLGAAGYLTATTAALLDWTYIYAQSGGYANTIDFLGWLGQYPLMGAAESARQLILAYTLTH